MRNLNHALIVLAAMFVLSAAAAVQGAIYVETFESYPPATYTTNLNPAFGTWRTTSMQSGTQVSVTSAGAVAGNDSQVLRIHTTNTDTGAALNASMSITEGLISLAFDFNMEFANSSSYFLYINATDGANTGTASTLFRMGTIDMGNGRYRIGSEATNGSGGYSGTSEAQTLAFGDWYRYEAVIDLDSGVYGWTVYEADGTPTAVGLDGLAVNSDSPRALESLWFGKVGGANDMTLNIDNIGIGIIPEPASLTLLGALGLGVACRRRRKTVRA